MYSDSYIILYLLSYTVKAPTLKWTALTHSSLDIFPIKFFSYKNYYPYKRPASVAEL